MFQLSDDHRYFLRNGKPHFFRLDTAWMAFSHLDEAEFTEYVHYRRAQGYNGLLIQSTLAFQDMPAHFRQFPVAVLPDGSYDWTCIQSAYFDQATRKLALLRDLDMDAFVVPIWVSAIPGSQMENVFDCTGKQFPSFEVFTRLVDYTIDRFAPYHPVWLIGGDADLNEHGASNHPWYGWLAARLRKRCPDDLIGAHTSGGSYPDPLYTDNGWLDFHTYQSGHMNDGMDNTLSPFRMAQALSAREPRLPVLNLEPMYEAHGYGNRFGRFGAHDVRRAFWYSILGGAVGGFAYGAHGIWMFYDGNGFNNENWSKEPMRWRDALRLPGAEDASHAMNLVHAYGMQNLVPAPDLNLTSYGEILTAATPDASLIVAYSPYMNRLDLACDLTGYDCRLHLFDGRNTVVLPQVRVTDGETIASETATISAGQRFPQPIPDALRACGCMTRIDMPPENCDFLLIAVR